MICHLYIGEWYVGSAVLFIIPDTVIVCSKEYKIINKVFNFDDNSYCMYLEAV